MVDSHVNIKSAANEGRIISFAAKDINIMLNKGKLYLYSSE